MLLQLEIKNGLHYQLKTLPYLAGNNSWLEKTNNSLILTCVFSGLDCNLPYDETNHVHEIQFTFHNQFLKTFSPADDEITINTFPEHQQHIVCCTSQMILHDIITCKLSGGFRSMFLESKALSLLLCFKKCSTKSEQECTSCKFLSKPFEKEKIHKAKEIILCNLNNPLTILELSVQIGINQCYLKKGFKEIYGTTVYDFIQEQRMLKAKLLLHTNQFSVSQVAEQIGFASQSSFSTAFKKFTGVFPSELQQN